MILVCRAASDAKPRPHSGLGAVEVPTFDICRQRAKSGHRQRTRDHARHVVLPPSMASDAEEVLCLRNQRELLEHLRMHDEVHEPRFVLQRHECDWRCRPRSLPTDDEPCEYHRVTVGERRHFSRLKKLHPAQLGTQRRERMDGAAARGRTSPIVDAHPAEGPSRLSAPTQWFVDQVMNQKILFVFIDGERSNSNMPKGRIERLLTSFVARVVELKTVRRTLKPNWKMKSRKDVCE